jgi:large subunit ribosomal protein LP2
LISEGNSKLATVPSGGGGGGGGGAAAAGGAAAGGAAAEETKEEAKEEGKLVCRVSRALGFFTDTLSEKEESDDDMGFGLFD